MVTLSKKGTDNLVVSNITIDTKAPDSKKNKESGGDSGLKFCGVPQKILSA